MSKSFEIANREFDRLQSWLEDLHARTVADLAMDRATGGASFDKFYWHCREFERWKADYHRLLTACGLAENEVA